MRLWTPALVALALVGCGISKQDHQKALDQQKAEFSTASAKVEAELKSEIDKARADLVKAGQDLDAAKKAAAEESAAKTFAAEKKLALSAYAEKAREAQVATLEKRFDDAIKLSDEVGAFAKDKALEAVTKALDEASVLLKKKDVKAAPKIGEAAAAISASAK